MRSDDVNALNVTKCDASRCAKAFVAKREPDVVLLLENK